MPVGSPVSITVHVDRVQRFAGATALPVEIGRLDPTRSPADLLHQLLPLEDGGARLVIADKTFTDISRNQLRIESSTDQALRIVNLSSSIAVECLDPQKTIPPGLDAVLRMPLTLRIGRVVVAIESAVEQTRPEDDRHLRTLAQPPRLGDGGPVFQSGSLSALVGSLPPDAVDGLVGWWRHVVTVLQSASNSTDFFNKASQAIVRMVGLDLGAVFLHEGGQWRPSAMQTSGISSARPSTGVLDRVLAEGRTFWNRVDTSVDVLSSMASIEAYVASPILDPDNRVIGALYGHRSRGIGEAEAAEISSLEALLVETLACGVAAGLARLDQQKAALQRKVQFEQFFSSRLALELEKDPDLLRGKDADVTVLFCDIRNFSGITERLGPAQTMEWVSGVLSELSEEVAATDGVLVDYIGDELMAMWGAPSPQQDHAHRACQAAQRMMAALPRIDAAWQTKIGCPTMIGIGVHSERARVGNTGSTRKFKYGPLGNGVNLASRVQGTTKYLRVPLLVTGATRRRLDDSFLVRQLCTVQVVNIQEPVDLFEIDCIGGDGRRTLFARYEEARRDFEQGKFAEAARTLGDLLAGFPNDGPSLVLLSRAVENMLNEPKDFSPVWRLPGK